MDAARPTAVQVADRALVLYALVRRGYIEHVIANTGGDPLRIRQGESAREETDRWLDRETLRDALTEVEARLFDAPSGSWPASATADAMWRKESLGALLWALQHVESSTVSTFVYLQPVMTAIMAVSILGERPSARIIPSALLIAAGVGVAIHEQRVREKGPSPADQSMVEV